MKLENILVPVDFSDCSNNALSHAIELAKISKARLTLLHCYTVHVAAAEVTIDLHPQLSYEFEENAKKSFDHLRAIIRGLENVPHEEIIRMSFIKDGIIAVVSETNTDLIVMGTKGAGNRIDAVFGSNTYSTIKKSEIPVLAVPSEAKYKVLKNMLFAADFKHIEHLDKLDIIKMLASLFRAKVEVLHVGAGWTELNMRQTKEAAAIVEYFGHTDHSYHFIKEEVDVEDAIHEHLEKHNHELLILIARSHHFPGALFKKRLTRQTVMHTNIPLLAIPDLK